MRKIFCLSAALVMSGCASIKAVPLDGAAEKAVTGGTPGFRIPRMTPYLVVAQLPPPQVKTIGAAVSDDGALPHTPMQAPPSPRAEQPVGNSDSRSQRADRRTRPAAAHNPGPTERAITPGPSAQARARGAPGGAAKPDPAPAAAGGDKDKGAAADAAPAQASTGSGSDTAFAAQSDTFVMRIVYLPDYRHSVAVQVTSGLFGNSSLSLSLQNGMLTGVNAKVDNSKAADVAVAALQAITTLATGPKPSTPSAAAAAPGGRPAALQRPPLKPGVYAFVPSSGANPLGLCTVAFFTQAGIEAPSAAEMPCSVSPPK